MNANAAPCAAPRRRVRSFRALAATAAATALVGGGLLVAANPAWAGEAGAPTTSAPASAPMMTPGLTPIMNTKDLPSSVLLFPAIIGGDNGAVAAASMTMSQKSAQHIVTESLRSMLGRGRIGVVVYNRRLPSVQRALQEGVKPEDANAGPGDDPRKAQRFANILGANEYLTTEIDDYKYDPASRTVTYNLSINRYGADGTSMGATAVKAIGSAPAEISGANQESFANQAAAQVASEQAIEGVYPQVAAIINPPKDAGKHRRGKKIGGKLLIPAVVVGAALIGPRT